MSHYSVIASETIFKVENSVRGMKMSESEKSYLLKEVTAYNRESRL